MRPLFQSIPYQHAQHFAQFLEDYANLVYLHSAQVDADLGRYSFIALDPILIFDSLAELEKHSQYQFESIPNCPPFQGGIAGFISYDCARQFETLPTIAKIEKPIPDIKAGLYDLVISSDHIQQQAWIFSSGIPEVIESKRLKKAENRLNWALTQIENSLTRMPVASAATATTITSNFTKEKYLKAVAKVIDYILEGDIFQANLSQQFSAVLPNDLSPFQLFQRLMKSNPAPFAAFIQFDDLQIASSSPERFLKIQENKIEARPIKGTIKRSKDPVEDQQLANQLLQSEKDFAENAMIVDLMRNDLSKICNNVNVEKLCGLESFATVHHLVSVVAAQLKENISITDLFKAVLPGGSITGAPKIRAMEIIEELEPTRRGIYCGNAFYFGFNQQFDSSILIRTFAIQNQIAKFQAGGAVVLDSTPENEFEETIIKAQPLMRALQS